MSLATRDQLLGDKALAVLEPPGLAAAQLLGGRGAELLRDLVEIDVMAGTLPGLVAAPDANLVR